MRIDFRLLLPFLLMMAAIIGCDSSEDPNLLNPPLPDSARARVVNLVPDEQVDVSFPGLPVATGVGSFQISSYRGFLLLTSTPLTVKRTGREKLDTVSIDNTLSQGARITYVVLKSRDTSTLALILATGKQQVDALIERQAGQVYFINAVDDESSYYIKSGCQSGATVFQNAGYAATPTSIETQRPELSLYLFGASDSLPITSAHVPTPIGSITYLIAAKRDGVIRLYMLSATGDAGIAGPLQMAPVEERTTASVEILNATADAMPISASLGENPSPIVTGLGALSLSSPTQVEACVDPLGDSLLISANGGAPFKTPIALQVGGRSVVVVYDSVGAAKALVLARELPQAAAGKVYLRAVNVSPSAGVTSISVGAGGPNGINPDFRPFGSLNVGVATDYVELPGGNYPLILSSALTGHYMSGGMQNLPSGFYTLFVVERLGEPSLMIVRDDVPGSSLQTLEQPGVHITFFNLIPSTIAQFTVGPYVLPSLSYTYVFSTVLPYGITTIGSNAGQGTVDPGTGGYVAGLTGSVTDKRLLLFQSDPNVPPPGKAAIRFLHAVPDTPELMVRIGKSTDVPADSSLTYGVPSQSFLLDERKYSFFISPRGDTTILARADGVQLIEGRHYLVAIAPKNPISTSADEYTLLVIQE